MKIYQKKFWIIVLVLIAAGMAIAGIGYAITKGNEGNAVMENQSYAVSDINAIQVNTDSPNVVITPVDGNSINLSWQTDEYVEYSAELTDGTLSIEYRIDTNWLKSLVKSWLSENEYILEIELPAAYAGSLNVHTVSGKLIADTNAPLTACTLSSISGTISAANIQSAADIAIRSTSGKISVQTVHAAGELQLQGVSGSVSLVDGSAADVFVKTTSGSAEIEQLKSEDEIVLESVSGALRASDLHCAGLTAKSVSGSIRLQELTADTVLLKSTSGSVSASLYGSQSEYSISTSTVSGKNNLQNAAGSSSKKLTAKTVSGSIDVQFVQNEE